MAIKQCKNCTHAKLCKFMDMTDQVKQDYPFVEDITCGYYEREQKTVAPKSNPDSNPVTATGTEAPENTEPAVPKVRNRRKSPETSAEPPSDDSPEPMTEVKVEPKAEAKEQKRTATKNAPKAEPAKEKDTLEFNDIDLSLFNISERSVQALNNVGIRIIQDVYDFDKSKKKWVSIKGFTKEHYSELAGKLVALNRPPLKPYTA